MSNMVRRTTLLGLLLAPALVASSAKPDVEKGVLAAEKQFVEAMLKADRGTLDKLLGDDLSYTHSSAKTQTKADLLEDVTGGHTKYESIDFEDTHVREYGNTAVVTHKATIKTVQTGVAHLYLTEVWARQGGRWQLVSRQATKLP